MWKWLPGLSYQMSCCLLIHCTTCYILKHTNFTKILKTGNQIYPLNFARIKLFFGPLNTFTNLNVTCFLRYSAGFQWLFLLYFFFLTPLLYPICPSCLVLFNVSCCSFQVLLDDWLWCREGCTFHFNGWVCIYSIYHNEEEGWIRKG